MKLSELAMKVCGKLVPAENGDIEINGVAALRDADKGHISFLANRKYTPQLAETKASAVLVGPEFANDTPENTTFVVVESADKAFAEIVPMFVAPPLVRKPGIHPTAVIGVDVQLGADVYVGPYAVIGDGAKLGARCVIEAHVFVGEYCQLGDDVHIYPMASIRERCKLGNRVTVHNGTVIGGDGFGYTTKVNPDGTINVEKIDQLGIVELCDDVEIGCNTTIDRARFGVTRIGNSTKIDNLVQIGHNVQTGAYCGIVSHVGISGSTHLGNGVMLWGQVGVAGHLNIGDRAEVLAKSGVSKDLAPNGRYFGAPAVDAREGMKVVMVPKQVDRLKKEVEELKAKIKELEEKLKQ
jgi:UDP-3-O-[3-hydroxymyristoyl] glucosamine N-acyltransferase